MLSIHRTEVPEYLQKGDFFAALDPDDDDAFELPTDCFTPDANLVSQSDLHRLLCTLNFWSVETLPLSVLDFVLAKHHAFKWVLFLLEHQEWRSILSSYLQLAHLPDEQRMCRAISLRLGISTVQWLHEHSCELRSRDCEAAARVNDLHSLKYLRDHGCPWDHNALDAAIQCGSIECFTYAMDHQCENYDHPETGLEFALQTGSTAMIRHMHKLGYHLNSYHLNHAIRYNQIESMRVLRELGVIWNEHVIFSTLENDAVECLQYLIEHGCQWGEYREKYCAFASLKLRVSHRCFRYAYTHGCVLSLLDLRLAAERGDVECLRYAHESGVEWDDDVYCCAMHGESTWACRWYVLSRGCPARSNRGPIFSIALFCFFAPFMDTFTISWIVVAFVSAHVGRETVDQPNVLRDVISIPMRDALRVVFGWAKDVTTAYLLWRMVVCICPDRYD